MAIARGGCCPLLGCAADQPPAAAARRQGRVTARRQLTAQGGTARPQAGAGQQRRLRYYRATSASSGDNRGEAVTAVEGAAAGERTNGAPLPAPPYNRITTVQHSPPPMPDRMPEVEAVVVEQTASSTTDPSGERTKQQLWKAAIKLPMYSVALVPLTVRPAAALRGGRTAPCLSCASSGR